MLPADFSLMLVCPFCKNEKPVMQIIAGYTIEQVAPLFAPALSLENVYLPQGFIKVLRR